MTRSHIIQNVVLLVVLAVLGFLVRAWSLPAIGGGDRSRDPFVQTLSNMRQLQLATQQMALDGEMTSNVSLNWPGNTGASFAIWARTLVDGGYLSTNDLDKLLSARGRVVPVGTMPVQNTNAILVYAARVDSPGNTVFLSSVNFTNTPSGGEPPLAEAKPFGNKGFVLIYRSGEGAILQNRRAGNTNLVGSYAPLCR